MRRPRDAKVDSPREATHNFARFLQIITMSAPMSSQPDHAPLTDPERITIVAREFSAAALEFHRGRMAERGYRLEGSILPRTFQMIDGDKGPADLFDGEVLFAVTFVKRDAAA